MSIEIEIIGNGFLQTVTCVGYDRTKTFHAKAEDLLKSLLLQLENKSANFGGARYGAVHVSYTPGETWVSPQLPQPA